MMSSIRRTVSILSLLFAIILFSTSCSMWTAADTSINLAGKYYYVQNNATERVIFERNGSPRWDIRIVDAYVDKVAFDHECIFAQQLELDDTQSPADIKKGAVPAYYVILVESSEVLGPMTEAEFEEWYAALGREEPPKWISTKNQPALIDRWEELNPGQSYE